MGIFQNITQSIPTALLFFLLIVPAEIPAQQKLAPNVYLVKFIDKKFNSYSLESPLEFLSKKAIARRTKQNIVLKENDLPVSEYYTDSLKKMGFSIVYCSKWLNAAALYITDSSKLKLLGSFNFIQPVLKTKTFVHYTFLPDKFLKYAEESLIESYSSDYGPSFKQIALHNGQFLHSLGFKGKGIVIAVLDAGFFAVKDYTSLHNLWLEKRVLLTRDFVDKTGNSFYSHSHGSNVLSIMAGNSQGNLIGTAPEADYILLRTEDASSEYPIEEFNWVVAAEMADSAGADIIQSSLGYSTFSEPDYNYSYSQMDGKHAISSIGAKIAASKGIVVVSSAGNEGGNAWRYMTAPADADSILAVGAVDSMGNRAYFSSFGPTSDKRIKPDVVAKGYLTYIQSSSGSFVAGNGTSYAAPVISGLTACLWQALPNLSNMQIIQAVKKYASQANNPDTILGYGIPDYKKIFLSPEYYPRKGLLFAYPNPFQTYLNIEFEAVETTKSILTITNLQGKIVLKQELITNSNAANQFKINELRNISKGVYVLQVTSGSNNFKTKIIKI
jgi:hypothetical protein